MLRHFVGQTSHMSADHAAHLVDLPGLFLDLHAYRPGRAFALAGTAGDASFRVDHDMPPGYGSVLPDGSGYIRVAGADNRLLMTVTVILRNVIVYHLSVQPIQGSMDRTITGTSASSAAL